MTFKEIGRVVTNARKAKGLTQDQVVEEISLKKRSYVSIEKGEGTAGIKAYQEVSEFLDVAFALSFPIKKQD